MLHGLYGRITVPEAVAEELNVGRFRGVHLPEISSIDWITITKPHGQKLLPLAPDLGPGEREALALAVETKDSLLVLDDSLARRYAGLLGLRMTGTLGVLLKAKQNGYLKRIDTVLNSLEELGFHLDTTTRRAVLTLANE
ncbi:MAG: DUF3368 domain-containing protein [Blastocatellia bacterium]